MLIHVGKKTSKFHVSRDKGKTNIKAINIYYSSSKIQHTDLITLTSKSVNLYEEK